MFASIRPSNAYKRAPTEKENQSLQQSEIDYLKNSELKQNMFIFKDISDSECEEDRFMPFNK